MLDFIIKHKVEIIAIILGLWQVASIVVRLTPTTKDDDFLKKLDTIFIGKRTPEK